MFLRKKLLVGAVVSSLGGLFFGIGTAVISGAEQSLKAYFGLDGFAHGFTNSVAFTGTMIGALLAFLQAQ